MSLWSSSSSFVFLMPIKASSVHQNVMAYRRKRPSRPAALRRRVRRRQVYRTRRRYRAKASRTTISRTTSVLVPDRYRTKLRYSALVRAASPLGVPAAYTFRLNSLYDPDYTGTGAQPYGFDQLSAFYNNYCVTGSSIRVVPLPTQDDTVSRRAVQITVLPSTSSTAPYAASPWTYREVPYNRTRNVYLPSNTFFPSSIIKHYMPVHKLAGVSRQRVLSAAGYSSTVSDNPATSLYWHVIAAVFDQSNLSISCDCQVTITYYVNFFGRVLLPSS